MSALHRMRSLVLGVAALTLGAAPALAWGAKGHQVIAMIAERRLAAANPAVLSRVRALLGSDLHEVSSCPDVIRGYVRSQTSANPMQDSVLVSACGADIVPSSVVQRYPASADWHFINLKVPLSGEFAIQDDAAIAAACAEQQGCVSQKVVEFAAKIRSAGTPLERRDAIIFLIHLLGDLHQPLHDADRNRDQGGNLVTVTYGGVAEKLHGLWDNTIIDSIEAGGQSNLTAAALAELLVPQADSTLPVANIAQVNDWVREAYQAAVLVAYHGIPDNRDPQNPFAIDKTQYQPPAETVVRAQLTHAGERLAAVLIAALGDSETLLRIAPGNSRVALRHSNAVEFMPPGVTKNAGCVPAGHLPDPGCTPGAVMGITTKEVCTTSTSGRRHVTSAMKTQIFEAYGITTHPATGAFEIDHFIPLELGGSNDIANLWPQPATPTPGFHEKDKVETFLHNQVCKAKVMTLAEAQRIIATDWLTFFNQQMPH